MTQKFISFEEWAAAATAVEKTKRNEENFNWKPLVIFIHHSIRTDLSDWKLKKA